MALIGYLCSYVPVEILAATGHRPYRLLHADLRLSQEGERYARVDACPLIKSSLAYLIEHRAEFACIVGASGCDMSRRAFDIIRETTDLPSFLIDNPRTDRPVIYRDEIGWLVQELEKLFSLRITPEIIRREITTWDDCRTHLRALDVKRRAKPSFLSTSDLHKALIQYHKGEIEFLPFVPEDHAERPRVFFLGSPLPYEANDLLRLIETRLRIVGDFNCGLSRFLNLRITDPSLDNLIRTYWEQPPCILKRSNRPFYEHIIHTLDQIHYEGVIVWTMDYCDAYEFELQRLEAKLNRPMLRLRSDLSLHNLASVKTRIEAFAEMLL